MRSGQDVGGEVFINARKRMGWADDPVLDFVLLA